MDADEPTFSALSERHRRELQAHCYRMVGSFEDAEERTTARRYVDALDRRDFTTLAELVRADTRFSFPPRAVWYDGLDAFRRASDKHAAPGEHLFVPAAANLQPAFASTFGPQASA